MYPSITLGLNLGKIFTNAISSVLLLLWIFISINVITLFFAKSLLNPLHAATWEQWNCGWGNKLSNNLYSSNALSPYMISLDIWLGKLVVNNISLSKLNLSEVIFESLFCVTSPLLAISSLPTLNCSHRHESIHCVITFIVISPLHTPPIALMGMIASLRSVELNCFDGLLYLNCLHQNTHKWMGKMSPLVVDQ